MIAEVEHLRASGLSWKRLESFGLEYRAAANFLQDRVSKKEMLDTLEINIRQFAKRQMSWFKRDKRIRWHRPKDSLRVIKMAKVFLKK